ncbi:hypothetical protein PoB_003788700 [Plakobranchus ocellatus]|uniref:Uncharacterized protein n=1 Tax=Plakobranchus ocellatus TaxID=259542 RepID=A0AAV4AWF0_9GAST|nr:hypothetical protein PoB_003788700 [Plakobranchus ocellatus]
MASKFVVYIAVVCVSLIAFCTVESCIFDYDDCVRGEDIYRHSYSHVFHLPNGRCERLACWDGDWRHMFDGCFLDGECYRHGKKINGRKCSDVTGWILKRGEICETSLEARAQGIGPIE